MEDYRPSYFKAAAPENSDRSLMNELYRRDVKRWKFWNEKVPPHQPFTAQQGLKKNLRIVSWNVNNLCGLSRSVSLAKTGSCIEACEIATVLSDIGADVIVIQEALVDHGDYDDAMCEAACYRTLQLDDILRSEGYVVHRSNHAQPVAIASRLPVSAVFSVNLDYDHKFMQKMSCSPGRLKRDSAGDICTSPNETRPLLFCEIQIDNLKIGIFGAHFHHTNYNDSSTGIRVLEANVLLSTTSAAKDLDFKIIAADFNQPLERYHTEAEWEIVKETRKRLSEPVDDGVDRSLADGGWRCTWDIRADRNFPGLTAPPMTHWTAATVDAFYVPINDDHRLVGTYVFFTELSDHLPIIADIEI